MQVEELLDRESIYHRPAGKDTLIKCLNPSHEDSNPSMRVDRITGLFNCFSCGFKGNLFTHFNEAVDLTGLKVLQLKNKIINLSKKGLTVPVGAESFSRVHRNIAGKTYEHFNAFIHNEYEDRIVFPIRDITGNIVAFLGRYAFSNASPKYLISPDKAELPIWPPKVDVYKDTIIIVEGLFDVLNLWDKGLTNAVCTFGKTLGSSTNFSKRASVINKFVPYSIQGVKKIIIVYDFGAINDANKLKDLLSELFIVEVLDSKVFTKEKDCGNLTGEEVTKLKEDIYG